MNDHYDVMTLKIEQSGNMRTEYLYSLCQIIYARVTSNWMSEGFIPFWQRRYCRIKIPSQWVIIIQTLNSVREDLTFDSQQTVCTEVFILSQCLIDLQVFDRQLDHHFLVSICTIHDFNDAGQSVTSCLSPGHISIYKCLKHDLAWRWQRDYPDKYFLLSLCVSDWDSGLFQAMVTLS